MEVYANLNLVSNWLFAILWCNNYDHEKMMNRITKHIPNNDHTTVSFTETSV